MANKISIRLQTPPDENGERIDMHPITTSDEVIANPDSRDSSTLTDKLSQITGIKIQKDKPAFSCIWAKPV